MSRLINNLLCYASASTKCVYNMLLCSPALDLYLFLSKYEFLLKFAIWLFDGKNGKFDMKLQTEQILYQWIKILNKIRKIYDITREQHS